MMKRWSVRLFLCLLLGILTTVAVAWGLALWSPCLVAELSTLGESNLRLPEGHQLSTPLVHSSGEGFGVVAFQACAFLVDPVSTASAYAKGYHMRSGWPAPSLAGRAWQIDHRLGPGISPLKPAEIVTERAIKLSERNRANDQVTTGWMMLPLRPILPGFIINTLLYAAIWFVLFFGFGALRRTIRCKRGRCVKCSYDLRGAADPGNMEGCPECGWGRV